MQLPYMYLKLSDGWHDITASNQTICSLAKWSIEWGTDSLAQQPEPSVLSFTIRDRTGTLAGKAVELVQAQVILYLSSPPTWSDIASFGSWEEQTATLETLHKAYRPIDTSQIDPLQPCLFAGVISNGGKVTQYGDEWGISLSATSQLVLWKRLQSAGPTSNAAKHAGRHWVGTPSSRLAEMNARAAAIGAPVTQGQVDLPPAVSSYTTDEYPSQYELLSRLTAHNLVTWYEHPRFGKRILEPFNPLQQANITAHADGSIEVQRDNLACYTLDASEIISGNTLEINTPVTQFAITAKTAKADNSVLTYDAAQVTLTATDTLPANLLTQQSSITLDSDAVAVDNSGGLLAANVWQPSTFMRQTSATLLSAITLRYRPSEIVIDANYIEPANYAELYRCNPSAIAVTSNRFSHLYGSDGLPAFSRVWAVIGGVLSFRWHGDTPYLRHNLHVISVPVAQSGTHRWQDLSDWTALWSACTYTWSELSDISTYTN